MRNSTVPALIHLQWFGEDTGDQKAADAQGDASSTQGSGSWLDDLPDPLKKSPSLQKLPKDNWKEHLAKSYVELEGKLGRTINLPKNDAKPEEWDRFYSQTGRPKKAEDYAIVPPKGADDQFMSRIKTAMHESGLSQAQAARVFQFLTDENQAALNAITEGKQEAMRQGEAQLRQDWGANYDTNRELAIRYVERIAGSVGIKHLEDIGIANDPTLLKLLANAGRVTTGKPLIKGMAKTEKAGPYPYMNE